MSIQLISISHKTAPLHVRELFAFSESEQLEIMRKIIQSPVIEETVIIATCNRTEVYTYSDGDNNDRDVFEWVQNVLTDSIHKDSETDISGVIRFYYGNKAIRHLFEVACGLDSMVIGEDQILGQVKNAHKQAMENHLCGTYLNTFFRYAVTAAKKVKTETKLSKTPVSTASICIKAAENYVGRLAGKNVMIIGASGKIGGIVVKNLLADYKPNLFATARNFTGTKTVSDSHHHYEYTQISYEERYQYLKDMDVVISATSSPHYTMTYENVIKHIVPGKKMAFMDLAVPLDIESRIGTIENVGCFNIDDFSKVARDNNDKKLEEAGAARDILEEYEIEFKKWMLFQRSLNTMRRVKAEMIADYEEKGIETAIDKLFYRVRESVQVDELENFLACLERV